MILQFGCLTLIDLLWTPIAIAIAISTIHEQFSTQAHRDNHNMIPILIIVLIIVTVIVIVFFVNQSFFIIYEFTIYLFHLDCYSILFI